MTLFDDDPANPFTRDPSPPAPADSPAPEYSGAADPLASDPRHYDGSGQMPQPHRPLPDDIRVSWSWPHFIVFAVFTVGTFFAVQTAFALYYAPHQHLDPQQLEHYLLNKPEFLFGSNIVFYALVFLFLFMTLAVLRGAPFWSSLGWKRLKSNIAAGKGGPWLYFLSGSGLAVFVFIASANVKGTENMPIQEVLKNRNSAILLMVMAVVVAPLVEETVFRGYLYPLFAKTFGMLPAILLTGVLFGLMHAPQLAWTWGVVVLLCLVGVIFTFARAYTGTVLASYLLHLGYNSMIAVATVIGTRGFTHLPTP
jgi:membrane protease YdiL (CAAX protease family)